MNLSLSEEQELLRATARRFVDSDYPVRERRDLKEGADGFRRLEWKRFADLGWLTLRFAEADGGADGSWVELAVLLQELGRGLLLEPYVPTVVLAGGLIARLGSAAQRSAELPPIMEGDRLASVALLEPDARFDLDRIETAAVPSGGGYVLSGRKSMVWHGSSADRLIVSARVAGQGEGAATLFLVDARAAGIERSDRVLVDGHRASEVWLRDVPVEESAVLGEVGGARAALKRLTDEALVALGAEGLGCMQALHEQTLEYVKARKQFGQPVGSFQAVQHRLVDMFIACEKVESLLVRAVIEVDREGEEASRATSALKVAVGQYGRFVAQNAVQLHGGMGMTDEIDVGLYMKRLAAIDLQFGNADFHLQRFGALSSSTRSEG